MPDDPGTGDAGQAQGGQGGTGAAGGDAGQVGGAGVQPPAAGGTPGPFDHITDPAELRAVAARLQAEAAQQGGKSRDAARQQAAQAAQAEMVQKVAKALGLAPDEKADPAKLQGQIEQLTAQNTERDRELAIYRVALGPGMGVDVGRLLDSRAFMRKANAVDPGSDTAETDIKALITDAVASDQSLRARPGGAAGGSLEHAGGAGDGTSGIDMSKLHGTDLVGAAYAANAAK